MNKVIDTIMNHRSVRKFKNAALDEEQVRMIVGAAQMASSSSFRQQYSVIGITDSALKLKIAEISGQDCIAGCGHLFIFCADAHRIGLVADDGEKTAMEPMLENLLTYQVAVIDASLAAQNAILAAESLGLGAVVLGSVLHALSLLNEALGLPERVMPLFAVAVGFPDEQNDIKPRLPMEAVYYENGYERDACKHRLALQEYDKTMLEFYATRSGAKKTGSWSGSVIRGFSNPAPTKLTEFIKSKGFART